MTNRDFGSWHETHYEVVEALTNYLHNNPNPTGIVGKHQEEFGHGGLYDLAKELTDEFEELNKDREWDGDFFDEIEKFMNLKINQ